MDHRNTPSRQPFARPLSQPGVRDARHAPIPPPPYTLQAPLRTSQPTLNHDPFLPRRNEQEDSRQEPYKSLSQASFNLGNYAAGLQREASKVGLENRDRVQENGTSWMLGDGRIDRYRSHSGDGKQLPICFIQSPYTELLYHPCICRIASTCIFWDLLSDFLCDMFSSLVRALGETNHIQKLRPLPQYLWERQAIAC